VPRRSGTPRSGCAMHGLPPAQSPQGCNRALPHPSVICHTAAPSPQPALTSTG